MIGLIRKTLVEYVDVDPETITPETRFVDDLNINSYEMMSIIGNLESELGISVPDSELHRLQTVGDVLDYLKETIN